MLSRVCSFGFQFELCHVVVTLSFSSLRSVSLAVIVLGKGTRRIEGQSRDSAKDEVTLVCSWLQSMFHCAEFRAKLLSHGSQ